jgi:hypothetical protein
MIRDRWALSLLDQGLQNYSRYREVAVLINVAGHGSPGSLKVIQINQSPVYNHYFHSSTR